MTHRTFTTTHKHPGIDFLKYLSHVLFYTVLYISNVNFFFFFKFEGTINCQFDIVLINLTIFWSLSRFANVNG